LVHLAGGGQTDGLPKPLLQPRGMKACVRTGQPTQHPSRPLLQAGRQHLFEIMEPITFTVQATQYSAQHRQATRARQGYRRPRHGVIVSVPGSKSGRRAGACGVPASAIASLRGWWLSNLATFFICKDSRERTGTRNRSVRVQSSNTSCCVGCGHRSCSRKRSTPNSICYDQQRLLQM